MSSGKKVLIVDDEEQVRNLVKKYFSRLGYDTYAAGDGKEALDFAYKVDLVITDLVMPIMTGQEFIRKIKGTVPIIIISGSIDIDPREIGADFLLYKPVDFTVLKEVVDCLIK